MSSIFWVVLYINPINNTTLVYFSTNEGRFEKIEWLNNQDWKKFVYCLDNAILPRIILDMADELADGGNIYGIIYDDKVRLACDNYYFPTEEKLFEWNEVAFYCASGFFVIENKTDKDWSLQLSYKNDPNTRAIELLVRTAFRKGTDKISHAFNSISSKRNNRKYYDYPRKNLAGYAFIGHLCVLIVILFLFILAVINAN